VAIKLVRRTAWGAPASSAASHIGSTRGVKVHYLGSPYSSRSHSKCDDTVRSIRASHLANKAENYSDIAYNMLVCEHGYVYEGRGAHKKTGANGNSALNAGHYAVCALLGSSGLTKPSDAMLDGIRDAIEWLRTHGDAGNEIRGHRDGYATTCPGPALYAWVKKGAPRPDDGDDSPPPATGGTYTVKAGDTLSSIAKKYSGVSWTDIAKANGIKTPYRITPGQKLKIPAGSTTAPQKPTVDLSKLVAAAKNDPPKSGTPVSYSGAKTVEKALHAEGLLSKTYIDGHFGSQTKAAYAAWQRKCGYIGAAADGVPGMTSLKKLGGKHGFSVVA